jgi:hypothetical protein
MFNGIYNKTIIPVILIAIIPIGLLISSGVSELLSILLAIIYACHLIYEKKILIINNLYFRLLLILWCYLIINHLFSATYEINEYSLRSYGFIKYILFIFAFKFYLEKSKNFKLISLFWTFILIIVCFDVFFEYFNHHNILGLTSNNATRIASFLGKELKIGNFILGFYLLSASYLLIESKKKPILFLITCYFYLIVLITALYITGERANAIRGLFCLILFVIFGDSKILKFKNLFLIVTILTIIITCLISERLRIRFIGQIIQPSKNEGIFNTFKNSQYGAHYDTAYKIFKSHPIFGVGNKNFRYECQKEEYFNKNFSWSQQRCATHPHQIYLELISEHGTVGTLIILYIIFFIIYKNIKIYNKDKNLIHLASILFVLQTFLPLIPSGSFFVSWTSTIFWINFSMMMTFAIPKKGFDKK